MEFVEELRRAVLKMQKTIKQGFFWLPGMVATDLPGFAEPPTSPSLKCVKFVKQT